MLMLENPDCSAIVALSASKTPGGNNGSAPRSRAEHG
jgi:hypothetical protein